MFKLIKTDLIKFDNKDIRIIGNYLKIKDNKSSDKMNINNLILIIAFYQF